MPNPTAAATATALPAIRLEDVHRHYAMGAGVVNALDGISLSVPRNAYVAIMGPSGSGKSTLMNIIGCLDRPSSGEFWLGSQAVSRLNDQQLARIRNREIGFVFQTFNLLPRMSALANVEVPLIYAGAKREARIRRALAALEMVGLSDRVMHRPSEMSGGQRQRVAIARALVHKPKIVLADEPTANLDHKTGQGILTLMKEINRRAGTTFIFSTHDQKVIDFADHYIGIEDGEVRFLGVRKRGKWLIRDERHQTGRVGLAESAVSGVGSRAD